jgi:hypothetical protein
VDLREFSRGMIKQAAAGSRIKDALMRHAKWLFTKKTPAGREFNITKPAILAGTIAGYALAKAKMPKRKREIRMIDRAPQLTQDPSKVLY